MNRREFIANAVLGAAAVLGFGALAQRMLAFLYPVVAPEQVVEFSIAPESAVPKSGGLVVHSPAGHVALEEVNGEILAFSAVCTHLGCIVRWQPAGPQAWFCPCHRGTYDRGGRVMSGPPPRPLDPLPVAVRDGQVYVKLKVRPQTASPAERRA